jgi:uncharacterized cupredoxin-like copper-binding protein
MRNLIFASLLCVVLSGCGQFDYVWDSDYRVAVADWSGMQTVSVILNEYSFTPDRLGFNVGVPYRLQIINEGSTKHYFTAEKFFRSIATRKVQSNSDGAIKAPYFTDLEVYPGKSLDLYFIPVKKGFYELECTFEGHAAMGMVGRISIH